MPLSTSYTILDGGISRELMRIKAPFRQPEWSAYALIYAPEAVQQVHGEFIAAGADVVTTNSYALVPFHIGEERFRAEAQDLAALAGRLARAAADEETGKSGRKVLVAGSLPPIFGSYRPDLFDNKTVQNYLAVLVNGLSPYVDVWLGETLSLLAEAEAVQTAIRDTGKPLWISFTLDDHERKPTSHLRSGELVAEAAIWALRASAQAILFNCSRPEIMVTALRDTQSVFQAEGKSIPMGVYANAFVQNSEDYAANEEVSDTRQDLDIRSYASFAKDWVSEGATIIGGCCGIGVEHIRHLAKDLGHGKV